MLVVPLFHFVVVQQIAWPSAFCLPNTITLAFVIEASVPRPYWRVALANVSTLSGSVVRT